jgi:hypothetical protein
VQSKQLSITHQITIGTRQHINRQLVIAQQATSGNLHARLETQRWEQANDENVVDNAPFVLVIRIARAIVRDQACADNGGRDDDEESLDEENCTEPETIAGDAFGCDERSAAESEEGADEKGG